MSRMRSGARLRIAALGTLTLVTACAGGSGPGGPTLADVAGQLPTVPAQRARFFFYRDYEPYESLGRPYVTLNGEVAGISEPGGVFYRDVPAGTYLVAVRSNTPYPDQDKMITAAAGQIVYVKVASIKGYNSGDSMYDPDTFAVVVAEPAIGQRDIAAKRYFPNGS
jgi:Protein of unknown function (DUF2846)